MQPATPPPRPKKRRGFTLLELMIVIVIVAILSGFLLTAVSGSIRRARIVGVKSEISQLESAISKFKASYGIEPPSSIRIFEAPAGWSTVATLPADEVIRVNSIATIRTIWPQYDFNSAFDINGNGTTTDVINLTLGEALVFFLGGINGNDAPSSTAANNNVGNIGPCTGFSKNPVNPFSRGGSREAPLFEFQTNRFSDVDGDGFPEYRDSLPNQTNPYLYYSAYDGRGYQASELGAGGLSSIYMQANSTTAAAWKSNSHQLISPGYDALYGYGGAYLPSDTNRLPPATSGSPTLAERIPEADNITNFSDSVLQP